jgi:hypothetical protein
MRLRTANNNRRNVRREAHHRHWLTLKDDCQVCLGERGGVKGNENRIGGIVCCDYCHGDDSVLAMIPTTTADSSAAAA